MANGAGQVARILYKEIVEGDRRKADAESNDSDSGGGGKRLSISLRGGVASC